MSRLLGGIVGSLAMLVPAALILVISQGQNCDNHWWTCAPGTEAAHTAQLIGIVLFIVGPYVGYRLGAAVAPHMGWFAALGVVLGFIPGLVALAWGWWMPYAAGLMVAGSILGGATSTVAMRRQP